MGLSPPDARSKDLAALNEGVTVTLETSNGTVERAGCEGWVCTTTNCLCLQLPRGLQRVDVCTRAASRTSITLEV